MREHYSGHSMTMYFLDLCNEGCGGMNHSRKQRDLLMGTQMELGFLEQYVA
jgi:hypothetical protein